MAKEPPLCYFCGGAELVLVPVPRETSRKYRARCPSCELRFVIWEATMTLIESKSGPKVEVERRRREIEEANKRGEEPELIL